MSKSLYYLPDDVLLYTCDILNLTDKRSLAIINKENPFKNYLNNEYSSLIKIQRFYKRNISLPLHRYDPIYNSLFSKKYLMREYIASYPMEYLLKFPETYINKMKRSQTIYWGINLKNNSNLILYEIEQWIKNNLPIDTDKRTRRDIKKFLDHPKVTKDSLRYVGW